MEKYELNNIIKVLVKKLTIKHNFLFIRGYMAFLMDYQPVISAKMKDIHFIVLGEFFPFELDLYNDLR